MAKTSKLDFDTYLMAEFCMTYDEFQNLSNREKSEIKRQYQTYLGE